MQIPEDKSVHVIRLITLIWCREAGFGLNSLDKSFLDIESMWEITFYDPTYWEPAILSKVPCDASFLIGLFAGKLRHNNHSFLIRL